MSARRLIVPALLIALLMVVQGFVSGVFTQMSPRIELNAADYDLYHNQGLTAAHLGQLRNRTYTFEKAVATRVGWTPVNTVVTNENYPLFCEIKLIRGSFFSQTAARIGQNFVVIGDELSFELFRTYESIGLNLELNGIEYTVCGIYHRSSLLEVFSGDGSHVVYIPTNSDFDRNYAAYTAIQRAMFMPGDLGTFATNSLNADLSNITLNARNYLVDDYANTNRIVHQYVDITFFVMALLAILLMVEILLVSLAREGGFIRGKLQADSMGNILRENGVRLGLRLVLWIGLSFAIVLAYRLTAFELYLPSEYIPAVRILDFDYYKTLVIDKIQQRNIYYGFKAPGYQRLYSFMVWFNTAVTVINILLSIKLYRITRTFIKEGFHGRNRTGKSV